MKTRDRIRPSHSIAQRFAPALLAASAIALSGCSHTITSVHSSASDRFASNAARTPTSDSSQDATLAAKEKLLAQTARPSVKDVLRAFGGDLPQANPFTPLQQDDRIDKVMKLGPEMIAQFEYVSPGAVWAVLGRDTAIVEDLLEAYYDSLGIDDRVVRLDASAASFQNPGLELQFLTSAGLLPSPEAEATRSFVILDPTSWSIDQNGEPTSQARKLVAAYYLKHGGHRILSRVNAIGLGVPAGSGAETADARKESLRIKPKLDLEKFWGDSYLRIKQGRNAEPMQILYTHGDLSYLKPTPDSGEISWHGSFQPFVQAEDGRIVAPPGARSPRAYREHVLWATYEIIKMARSYSFRADVEKWAGKFGYDLQKTLRTDYRIVQNDKAFRKFAENRRWTQNEIESWRKDAFKQRPSSIQSLELIRTLELTALGAEQGLITDSELLAVLKEAVKRSAQVEMEMKWVMADAMSWLLTEPGSAERFPKLHKQLSSPKIQRQHSGLGAITQVSLLNGRGDRLPPALEKFTYAPIWHFRYRHSYGGWPADELNQLQETLQQVVPFVKKPEDFARILTTIKMSNHPRLDAPVFRATSLFVSQNIDTMIKVGATIREIKDLESRFVFSAEDHISVMTKALPLVKTPKDFVDLTDFVSRGYPYSVSAEYVAAMGPFVAQNIDVMIDTGATMEQIKYVVNSSVADVALRVELLDKAAARLAQNPPPARPSLWQRATSRLFNTRSAQPQVGASPTCPQSLTPKK